MASLSYVCSSAPSSSSSSTFSSPSSVLRKLSLNLRIKLDVVVPTVSHTGASIQLVLPRVESNRIVTHAVAEALTEESPLETEESAPAADVSKLKLESDLLKKAAKRAELRRKRLVRKRHMRKKGRWPPSKMAKLKNV